ncbi:flagellar associated protein [Thecamonas trahens ATCC 50062]|uniref:Flagellar associated protein n=1 Tax=Thecamonas trahens ATCC 50062 TaxID=461836 RepID=A0A0L0DR89_THETB|nr:flagellar associated protein [Thecamonas trahens ATCC 50062]KNC54767.1 flagellar associated protein [Thecamonas trahens ATCC 50062]|eukprot:XP_013761667.1 flagellar associated protein [Thecamonas trahens ATCC 50062]
MSTQIGMPNATPLTTVAWSGAHGYVAVGGEGGACRVLQLEQAGPGTASSFSMNQALTGHSATLSRCRWNEPAQRLTTAADGVIIVWALHDGAWFEQMVNERADGGNVADFAWSPSGLLIAIAYTDGMVILGHLSKERVWCINFDKPLTRVAWSPNGRLLLLATADGQVHLHDAASGAYLTRMQLFVAVDGPCQLPLPPTTPADQLPGVVDLAWFNDAIRGVEAGLPSLAVAFDNGCVQLMRSEIDDAPLVLDTKLQISTLSWDKLGSLLAVAGQLTLRERVVSVVQFYEPNGANVFTLKVPGGSLVTGLSWSGNGLRIALTVGSSIFFATVRPPRKWTYFANTLVYSYLISNDEHCITFWNTKTTEVAVKYIKRVAGICAAGQHAALLTSTGGAQSEDVAIVFDAIGNPLVSKYLALEPTHLAMTPRHVVVASPRAVFVWDYIAALESETPQAKSHKMLGGRSGGDGPPVALFHIDSDPASTASEFMELADSEETGDVITAVAASGSMLLVARASGTLLRYSLPRLRLETQYNIGVRAKVLEINCDGSVVAIIDFASALSLYALEMRESASAPLGMPLPDFERKNNVWAIKWGDEPSLLAAVEKDKLYVYRGPAPEEAVPCTSYLCEFSDLVVQAVDLDALLIDPQVPSKALLVEYETRSLRDTRAIVESVNLKEAMGFVADNPHPRLWRILAEAALEALDLGLARAAFIKYGNYEGLVFLKSLREVKDPLKQAAEVAAYFGRFDQAEKLYMEMNRSDLAIGLRVKVGDWFRVVKLIHETGQGDDKLRARAHTELGDYYAERGQDAKAIHYYELAHATGPLADAAYRVGDFDRLASLVSELGSSDALLPKLGAKLVSVGMADEAVAAYVKAGDVKAAVDACVSLQRWDTALRLAERHAFPGIHALLAEYADKLLALPGGRLKAIELYYQAHKYSEAGQLLVELAREAVAAGKLVRGKQLYVLAGLCGQAKAKMARRAGGGEAGSGSSGRSSWSPDAKLAGLMSSPGKSSADGAGVDGLATAWRGAQALHLYLLAQRQLHAGDVDAAMRTALRVADDFEAFLDSRAVASLAALTAYLNRFFKQASLAFIKLESLGANDEAYERLAVEVFKRNAPRDRRAKPTSCGGCGASTAPWASSCNSCDRSFEVCIATGATVVDAAAIAWRCGVCGGCAVVDVNGGVCGVCGADS